MTNPRGRNSVRGNTKRKEEERDKKWQANLFLLSYFTDSVGLYFWPPSFSVDFYLTSYFCVIRTMASRQFDIRLIPGFSGTATDIPIMEWLEVLELICELCKITNVEWVLPLQLKGATRETYKQLSKEQQNDIEEIKHALVKAYRTDLFVAFNQFTTYRLHPVETVDELLTDLQWLVGEMLPECWRKSTFMSHVRRLIWLSTRKP